MSMVGFPLLLIPFAIYNIIAFLMPSVSFDVPLAKLTLVSGAEWSITLSDVLLTLGILLLLLEVMKSARPGGKYLTDHLLSFLVLGATAAEFVMWQKFGTSTFFLLVLMAMVDFFSGIALRGRRAVAQPASRTVVARREPAEVRKEARESAGQETKQDAQQDTKAVPVEPHVEPEPAPVEDPPAPAPAVLPAASVAESVLMDRPEPRPAQPEEAAKPVVPEPEPEREPAAATEDKPSAPESTPEPTLKSEEVQSEDAAPAAVEPSPQAASPESHSASSPLETPKH
jgi:hypothetical protein